MYAERYKIEAQRRVGSSCVLRVWVGIIRGRYYTHGVVLALGDAVLSAELELLPGYVEEDGTRTGELRRDEAAHVEEKRVAVPVDEGWALPKL